MSMSNGGGAEVSNLILFDRSRTVTDWQCPRRRYYGYDYGGRGLVGAGLALELFLGTSIHDALAAIAMQQRQEGKVDIDRIVERATTTVRETLSEEQQFEVGAGEVDFAQEQAALVEGLLRGFHKVVWPALLAEYPQIVAVEQEMEYQVDDRLTFMAKPDLILANEAGEWVYIEYKSTSSKKEEWINSWNTAVQLHSTIKAVEATLGQAPTHVKVVGLYKGYVSYGKQNSPFCYCYKKAGNPPFFQDQVQYDYKPGFKRSPVWELEGGVRGWVEEMPHAMLVDQFPTTPPIFVNEDLVSSFFEQRKWREHEIDLAKSLLESGEESAKEGILDITFPQRFDQCLPAYGHGCPFRKLCFSGVDPLSAGYEWRESHHAKEAAQFAAVQAQEELGLSGQEPTQVDYEEVVG